MRGDKSSRLYRASRFYVWPRPRARRLGTRYQTAPAVVGGYALAGFFFFLVGFVGFVGVCRFFHVGLRHFLIYVAGVLQNLNH